MLAELSPKKKARDWLPPVTILYMAPGGHRQWPVSIKPLLDRLSWIVLKTRPLALMHLREALHDNPNWKSMYRQGPKVEAVPAVPLPVLVPTCPKKMFMHGPRLKYIDIVTDTLHASSSDLITWNNLVMMKLRWLEEIPRKWIDITTNSLETWDARDRLSQFQHDNRRGFARVTPIALSSVGVPGSKIFPVDEYPKHGLGIYDDYETREEFSGYLWATWTTMAAQPMQIDSALQAMIDQSAQVTSGQIGPRYDLGTSVNVDMTDQPMGSNEYACGAAAPFPESTEDVSMDSVVDKRSRE